MWFTDDIAFITYVITWLKLTSYGIVKVTYKSLVIVTKYVILFTTLYGSSRTFLGSVQGIIYYNLEGQPYLLRQQPWIHTSGRVKSLHSVLSHSRGSVSAWKRCLRVKSQQGGLSHSRLMLSRMETLRFPQCLFVCFVANHHVTT